MKCSKNKWQDHFARRAQKENYAARSVYKLSEIQKKFRIIKSADSVLDLGCAPGSWLKFAAEQTGAVGRVIGVDLKPVTIGLAGHVQALVGDIYQLRESLPQLYDTRFQVVLSDMAPATTGNRFTDTVRSVELCRAALSVSEALLRPGGRFVCKIFQGEDFTAFCDQVKERFDKMSIFKPQSSRKASREIFIIGLGKQLGGDDVRA